MADFTRFQEPVWDRFFGFVFDCDEDLTDEEVDEELRRRGIDVNRAFSRVQQVLRSAKAMADLEAARKSRPRILNKLKQIKLPEIGGTLEEVKAAIAREFHGQVQTAFFRKLEAAESEEDLKSLLDDAHLLDALSGETDDPGPEAE